jgi:tripartite-type tricarboxylate transporter receptor subunit TctC
MKTVKSILATLTLLLIITPMAMAEKPYPSKPVSLVVGYGVGGSSDRMTRAMSSFISEELGQPVKVVNKKGAATLLGLNYVFKSPADGYTIYSGAVSPYMGTHVMTGEAKFSMDDWAIINIQWPDYTLYAASKDSPYKTMEDFIKAVKENPGKVSAAAMQNSVGLLTLKLILKQAGIPEKNLNLVTYTSGGKARSAVAGGSVDLIAIAAEGCLGIKEYLVPLAIGRETTDETWNAPALNESLKPLGITVPVLSDAARGYAVPAKMKTEHPESYEKLVTALKNVTMNEDVKKFLKDSNIGSDWIGPEAATKIVKETAAAFVENKDVLAQ